LTGDYKGIHHVGITVSNLDRSVAFFRDIMGLNLLVPQTDRFEGEELEKGIGVPDAVVRIAIFEVDQNHRMECLEYFSPRSPVQSPLPPNALGAMHVSFHCADIEAKYNELKSKGVAFLTPINVIDEGPLIGWKWVYFKDPDGNTLELVQDQNPVTNP